MSESGSTTAATGAGRAPDELRVLDSAECLRLLGTSVVGRLGAVVGGYPVVIPVNYALDGDAVVVRLAEGTLLRAVRAANVCFQVDEIDPFRQTGWSVLVRGLGEELTDAHREELAARTRAAGVQPWAPGEREHWVRIIPHGMSGRRIVPGALAFEPEGYL